MQEKEAEESTEDIIKQYNNVFYQTSAKKVGEAAHLAKHDSKFGLKGQFTNNLMLAGNFKN